MGTALNIVAGGAAVTIGSDLGYIKDGITVTPTRELLMPENIEGLYAPPRSFLTKETYGVTFTLVETDRDNLKLWLDSTNTESGADPIVLDVGHGPSGDVGQPTERVLVIKGLVPGNAPPFLRTITWNQAVADAPGEFKITQFEEAAFPCSFTTIWDQTLNRMFQCQDAAS
jgi:hypothetical protein